MIQLSFGSTFVCYPDCWQWGFPGRLQSFIYDLAHDQTACGRTLKYLIIVDEFTHEGRMIYASRSIASGDVIRCLAFLFELYRTPECVKSDNGPEFIANRVQDWLADHHAGVRCIDPGSPWQNGHNESFNGVFRDGCLDRWSFYSISEARRVVDQWLHEYNEIRPHGSINMMTPRAFAAMHRQRLRRVA